MKDIVTQQKFAIHVSIDPQEEAAAKNAQPSTPTRKQGVTLPPPSQARRTHRQISYKDMYAQRIVAVDRRLAPFFDHLLESGPNKTVVANQWILKILLDSGYEIDPAILTKPFTEDDLV